MIRIKMAFPAVVLLLALSVSSAGQTFVEPPGAPVAPRVAQSPSQSPAESSVIVVKPELADEQHNIGTIWYQRKKYGRAIKAYQKAITIRNDMAVLHSNLGYAYFGDKKYVQAISSFRQALALDPQLFEHNSSRSGSILQDRSVGDRGRFYFLLAKSFAEAGNLERCLIYLRKAKDEGYKELSAAKTDPSFAAALKDPAIQEVLAPKPPDSTQP